MPRSPSPKRRRSRSKERDRERRRRRLSRDRVLDRDRRDDRRHSPPRRHSRDRHRRSWSRSRSRSRTQYNWPKVSKRIQSTGERGGGRFQPDDDFWRGLYAFLEKYFPYLPDDRICAEGYCASDYLIKSLDERKSKIFETRKPISEADLEGKTPDEQEMMKLMGFCGFDSTKGKKVETNEVGAVHVILKRKYRQYMNRKGGFNRPLDFVA
ncbi:Protein of unknown function (DUF1777) [Nesidiocoris tenuis]|uniref:U4/U6.U5 small nuclear ribonucleoprotein 27 kDa protein n=1 Tax=Nesidiocoris tenuis TaxID=355587 RepID=A0ABN7B3R7_9HEMI|nr:Protein of unknown function (DUF1777) [Nesidiocoris tenuis]